MRKGSTVLVASLLVGVAIVAVALAGNQMAEKDAIADTKVRGSGKASQRTEVEPVVRTITTTADFGKEYGDVSELVADSDAVVLGVVVDTRSAEYNDGVWTISTVKVRKSWTPEVSTGERITVVEEGGVTSEAYLKRTTGRPLDTPVTPADEQAKVKVLLDGAPLPKPGEQSVYFLARGQWDIVPDAYFDVVGAFQGKFRVGGGKASRHTPPGWSAAYRALDGDEAQLESELTRATRRH